MVRNNPDAKDFAGIAARASAVKNATSADSNALTAVEGIAANVVGASASTPTFTIFVKRFVAPIESHATQCVRLLQPSPTYSR